MNDDRPESPYQRWNRLRDEAYHREVAEHWDAVAAQARTDAFDDEVRAVAATKPPGEPLFLQRSVTFK